MKIGVVLVLILSTLACCGAERLARTNSLPVEVKAFLESAPKFELFSLQPRRVEHPGWPKFHDYKVLGKIPIKDPETRKEIIAALERGIKESNGMEGACFSPRHGIRASSKERNVDLVICFQCLQVLLFDRSEKPTIILITSSPQPTFNKVLAKEKIPLAE